MCVTGCPYKKVYFNHRTGKAEKCTICYPRIEVGLPTVCSETCVGRLRYLGLFLYDADKVTAAAATPDEKDLYEAQLDLILDPHDPAVVAAAERDGIPADWIDAARRSPVYELAKEYRVALPLHPEYRTMPMVWYIPPLSPVVDALRETGHDAEDADTLFGAIDAACGSRSSTSPSCSPPGTPARCWARWRRWLRCAPTCASVNLGGEGDDSIAEAVGLTGDEIYELYRLLAIAKYEDRYVIPKAHVEAGRELEELGCSLDYEGGPGWVQRLGTRSARRPGGPMPVAVENFHALKARQTAEAFVPTEDAAARVNLLNWDGAVPLGMPGIRRADDTDEGDLR